MAASTTSKMLRSLQICTPIFHYSYRNARFLNLVCGHHGNNLLISRRSYSSKRNILELHQRGIFHDIYPQTTDELPKKLNSAPQTMYCGVDPTAESLHIGNLLPLMGLLHCQRAGHKCIIVVGGATALVGDPSGKTKEREYVDRETITKNTDSIKESLHRMITNHREILCQGLKELEDIRVLNNFSWYDGTGAIDFLSSIGRHIRLGDMLSRHSVKSRLNSEEGMSFAEFSYQALQAYDFLYLHHHYDCLVQIGGNDQIGNMVTGHELVRKATGKSVYGLTVPLLTSADGNKLGKTAGNAIWINEDKTSVFDLYQYLVRLPDAVIDRYLRLLTFLPLPEIKEIMRRHEAKPANRTAQKKLAEQVLKLVHGDEGLQKALKMSDAIYNSDLEALGQLSSSEMQQLFQGAKINELILEPGETVFDIAMRVKCLPEGVYGEKIVKEGGFSINQKKIFNPDQALIRGEHILPNGITLIRVGKKNYHIIKWIEF
ncbi:tyrosine--tRNA ligase, mitochondrial-like [Amphiura filiformis]|uniref:tyrosine--tRNA ligase, mitochondrial-like n=1 Tax=Amphiura filiformis TaxID=82378 RepID=UPI003B212FF6